MALDLPDPVAVLRDRVLTAADRAFRFAIFRAPDDLVGRLSYADWLRDRDRHEEAEFWCWTVAYKLCPVRHPRASTRSVTVPYRARSRTDRALPWRWCRHTAVAGSPVGHVLPDPLTLRLDYLHMLRFEMDHGRVPPDASPLDCHLALYVDIRRFSPETNHGWLWWSRTAGWAFDHLWWVWSVFLRPEDRAACLDRT